MSEIKIRSSRRGAFMCHLSCLCDATSEDSMKPKILKWQLGCTLPLFRQEIEIWSQNLPCICRLRSWNGSQIFGGLLNWFVEHYLYSRLFFHAFLEVEGGIFLRYIEFFWDLLEFFWDLLEFFWYFLEFFGNMLSFTEIHGFFW